MFPPVLWDIVCVSVLSNTAFMFVVFIVFFVVSLCNKVCGTQLTLRLGPSLLTLVTLFEIFRFDREAERLDILFMFSTARFTPSLLQWNVLSRRLSKRD